MDFYAFPKTDRAVLNSLQDMLLVDVPRIISYVAGVSGSESDDAAAGSGSGAGSGNSSGLLAIFSMDETEDGGFNSRAFTASATTLVVFALAVVIAVTGIVLASAADEHATVMRVAHAIQQAVSDVMRSTHKK